MGVTGRHHQVDFIHAAGQRPLGSLDVGHQHGDLHAVAALNGIHHVGGIAQVGNGFGRNERRRFDARNAGGSEGIDQHNFLFGRDEALFALKTIAGCHFVDL